MRRLSLILAAAAALAAPAGASAGTVHGTVVHRVSHAHSFVVATRGGALHAVHSAKRPALGRVVTVRARRLGNGTYTARSVRLAHRVRRHAVLRGVVTHVDRARRAFVLSARGVSLVVHRKHRRQSLPAVGRTAVVDATLTSGSGGDEIEADDVEETGEVSTFEVEGIVQSVDQAAETVTISSDDEDDLRTDLVVTFPAGTDLSSFAPGSEVELRVTRAPDGTLTAVSGSRDDDEGDDDHGDQGDDDQGGDDHGGDREDGGDHAGRGDDGSGSSSGSDDHGDRESDD